MSFSRWSTAHWCESAQSPGDVRTKTSPFTPQPINSPKLPCCMPKILSPILLLAIVTLIQSASGQILKLTPLSTFGTNGNGGFYPNERDYLNSSNQLQRGLPWNPVTGHLLLSCRTNPASTDFRVLILDGATGETNALYPDLDMSGLSLGGNASFFLNLI